MPYVRAGGSIPPPPSYVPTPQYASAPAYAPSPPMPSYAGTGFASAPVYGAPPAWPPDLGLVVPQFAVETGDLPRICVVSGVPTTNMVRQRWMWAPSWTFVLGLLIRFLIADKVTGYLPITPRVHRLHTLRVVGLVLGFFIGFLLLLGGLAGNQPFLALLGLVLFIASPIVIAVKGNLVKVKRAAPGYLAIKNANPEFARAFTAGRPPGVAPYASSPPRFTSKTMTVLMVIVGLFMLLGLIARLVSGPDESCRCQSSNGAVHLLQQQTRVTLPLR